MLLRARFSRWHLWTTLALWLLFSGCIYTMLAESLDDARGRPLIAATYAAGSFLGPMIGAASRHWQSCCLDFSLTLLPYGLAALAFGLGVQVIAPPGHVMFAMIRASAWFIGLLVWFFLGILSLFHALG